MYKQIVITFMILYDKWIKGHCRHLCCLCGCSGDCLGAYKEEMMFDGRTEREEKR